MFRKPPSFSFLLSYRDTCQWYRCLVPFFKQHVPWRKIWVPVLLTLFNTKNQLVFIELDICNKGTWIKVFVVFLFLFLIF